MQRLHSEVMPAFFSNSFKPMNHLVRVLSAEARQRERQKTKKGLSFVVNDNDASDSEEDSATMSQQQREIYSDDDDEEEAVKVLTIEGKVVNISGLTPSSTVEDLRSSVEEKTGITVVEMRLYIDSAHLQDLRNLSDLSSRLEPLTDGAKTLGDLGVFSDNVAVHLRNREYEALRHQLQVATEVLEDVLEDHYDAFQENFERVRQMAKEFDQARTHVAKLKHVVKATRAQLGLPESRVFLEQAKRRKMQQEQQLLQRNHNNDDDRRDDDGDKADNRDSEEPETPLLDDDDDIDDDGVEDLPFARRRTKLIDVFEKKAEQDEMNRIIADLKRRSLLEADQQQQRHSSSSPIPS